MSEKGEEKRKRKRSMNFTQLETRILIEVIIKHISIVENKKTDAVTWAEKEKTWRNISLQHHALSGVERSASVCRSKYDSVKHTIKSKLTKNKMEIFKTGGGVATIENLKDYQEKLMGYITLNVKGLSSEFDSNGYYVAEEVNECTQNSIDIMQIPEESIIVENYNNEEVLIDSTQQLQSTNMKILEIAAGPSALSADTSEVSHADPPAKWSTWSPKLLKAKKHKALNVQNVTKDTLNVKLDKMVTTREELIQLQSEMASKELKLKEPQIQSAIQSNENSNKLHQELLLLKIEKEKLKIQLLHKQLNM